MSDRSQPMQQPTPQEQDQRLNLSKQYQSHMSYQGKNIQSDKTHGGQDQFSGDPSAKNQHLVHSLDNQRKQISNFQ